MEGGIGDLLIFDMTLIKNVIYVTKNGLYSTVQGVIHARLYVCPAFSNLGSSMRFGSRCFS